MSLSLSYGWGEEGVVSFAFLLFAAPSRPASGSLWKDMSERRGRRDHNRVLKALVLTAANLIPQTHAHERRIYTGTEPGED